MMLKDLLGKRKYITVSTLQLDKEAENRAVVPDGMWKKCPKCGSIIYNAELEESLKVCSKCGYHFRLTSYERVRYTFDKNTFKEFADNIKERNPIGFEGYNEKLKSARKKSEVDGAVITGIGTIGGYRTVCAIMDSHFMMGSMGTVVGERIALAVEYATDNKLPIIIFTTSGGARMQEGIFSLMQMAKISAALARHNKAGLLYITVITDPTTGGVTASFAMQGDIILSEPEALIGFAGRRVIENTINEKLPDDFQKAEFLLKKGFVDKIVKRDELRKVLAKLLSYHEVIR